MSNFTSPTEMLKVLLAFDKYFQLAWTYRQAGEQIILQTYENQTYFDDFNHSTRMESKDFFHLSHHDKSYQ